MLCQATRVATPKAFFSMGKMHMTKVCSPISAVGAGPPRIPVCHFGMFQIMLQVIVPNDQFV